MKKPSVCLACLLLAPLFGAALLAGCGSQSLLGGDNSQDSSTSQHMTENFFDDPGSQTPQEESPDTDLASGLSSGFDPSAVNDRKMVYTATVYIESKTFDDARSALDETVARFGGYIEYTSLDGSAERGDRYLSYTARIPVDNYTDFIAALDDAGNVTSFSESADDITNSYIDVEARLDALEEQRDRLHKLAEQAETTADLIEIESRLSEVQYELESYTRQIQAMDDQVSYCTVDLTLREVAIYTPVTHTFVDRITDAFFSGWRGFKSFVENFAILLVRALPFLLLAGVLLFIFFKATAKRRAERRAQRAAKASQKAALSPRAKQRSAESQPIVEEKSDEVQ